jgi:chorismate mutase
MSTTELFMEALLIIFRRLERILCLESAGKFNRLYQKRFKEIANLPSKKRSLNKCIPVLVQNNQKAASAVFFIYVKYLQKVMKKL